MSKTWRKVQATTMESSLQKIDRVKSWERCCSSTTCSFWLACLFLSNPTCFSPTNQLKSFEPAINKQEFLPFCMKEWLDCCMDVCLSYKHDIGLERLSYQSKINYFYQHQNITIETCSISEIAIIILSLKFIFEAAALSFTNLFFPPTRLVWFLVVVPFVAFRILLQQLQEKNKQQELSFRFERNAKHQGSLKIMHKNKLK